MTKYTIHRQDGNAGLDGYFEVRADGTVVFEALECDCRDYVRAHRTMSGHEEAEQAVKRALWGNANRHPDNPTSLECAAEYFADAVRIAKARQSRVQTAPWLPPQSAEDVIRETLAAVATSLIEYLREGR